MRQVGRSGGLDSKAGAGRTPLGHWSETQSKLSSCARRDGNNGYESRNHRPARAWSALVTLGDRLCDGGSDGGLADHIPVSLGT